LLTVSGMARIRSVLAQARVAIGASHFCGDEATKTITAKEHKRANLSNPSTTSLSNTIHIFTYENVIK
jgi:hypothetical protein